MSQSADFIHKEVKVKRQKVEDTKVDIPSSVVTHFTTQEGVRTGPPIEIPVTSTIKQLETLINALLENTDPVWHVFVRITNINNLRHHLCDRSPCSSFLASIWFLHKRR